MGQACTASASLLALESVTILDSRHVLCPTPDVRFSARAAPHHGRVHMSAAGLVSSTTS